MRKNVLITDAVKHLLKMKGENMRYEQELCPVCKEKFKIGDDVVVCPDCGTPHHRQCWYKDSACGNSALHSEGFIWQPEQKPDESTLKAEFDQKNELGKICPTCGTNCPKEYTACPVCQTALVDSPSQISNQDAGDAGKPLPQPPQSLPAFQFNNNAFLNALPCPPDTLIDTVSAGDAAIYLQTGGKRYIPKFLKNKKITWNWAAFFFSPFWFFFRKLYKSGFIAIGIFLAIFLVSSGPIQDGMEMYDHYIQQFADVDLSENPLTNEQVNEFVGVTEQVAKKVFPYMGINLLFSVGCALCANTIYRKKMIDDIENIRSVSTDERTKSLLFFKRGGVSLLAAAGSYCGYMMFVQGLTYLVSRLI